MPFKIKIAGLFILLTMVPVAIVTGLMVNQGRKIIQDQAVQHLIATNESRLIRFETWVQTNARLLNSLRELAVFKRLGPGPPGDDRDAGGERLSRELLLAHLIPFTRTEQFLELFILAPGTGRVTISTDPIQEGKYKDDQAYFRQGRERFFVQPVSYDAATQMPVMTMATPITDGKGRTKTVLAGRIDLLALSAIMEKRNPLIQTEDTYMVNKYNYFITEPRFGKGFALRKSVHTRALAEARKSGRFIGTDYLSYRDAEVIGVCFWLPEWELYLVTEIDVTEAYAPIIRLRNRVILTAVLICMAAALAGWFSSYALTRPLAGLLAATRRIGRGDLDIRLETDGKGEFQDLARSFVRMAEKLDRTMVSKERLEKEARVRKQAEKDLKKAVSDLERSNKDLQQFAYVASHDLQEPLRMVSSFTQLLSDRYRDHLDEKAQTYIHYAVDGAVRMQKLIQDLLTFSRVNTHGNEFKTVDTAVVLEEVLANLKVAVDETGARIRHDALPSVRVDPSQFAQLLQNLIANAIKFCREKQPDIRIAAERNETEWVFSVSDNGIGIEPAYREKVFVIFQRLHTRKEYPGTGLGLAVCQRIVQRHGGRIWFESEPGKGTVFYFSIPL